MQGLQLLLDRLQAAMTNAPLLIAEAAEKRMSMGGGRRQTRRISSVRRMSASAFMESRRTSLVGTTVPAPRRGQFVGSGGICSGARAAIGEAKGRPKCLQSMDYEAAACIQLTERKPLVSFLRKPKLNKHDCVVACRDHELPASGRQHP